MNLFVLDLNLKKAARYHSDKHVVKMVLETAQLLSTAHQILDGKSALSGLYQKTHVKHPCAIWVRENSQNYFWTLELFKQLLKEYSRRYQRVHACEKLLILFKNLPKQIQMAKKRTPFAQAMPKKYQNVDAVQAYRNYYFYDDHKRKINVWNHSLKPRWYVRFIRQNPELKIN